MNSRRSEEENRTVVRTLLGEDHVEIALKCLSSLSKQTSCSVRLVIHDDGTLTRRSKGQIREDLPVGKILSRSEADERIMEKLRSYPSCREYRQRSNFALKLFDVPLLSSEDRVVFSDSDILFVRPVKEMFDLSGENAKFCSNGHMGNAYAVSFTQVEPLGKIRLVDSLNSGLFSLKKTHYNLEFIESVIEYLSEEKRYWERPYWAEQTCWSAIAAEIGTRLWSFEDVSIPKRNKKTVEVPDAMVLHFASSVREALWNVEPKTNDEPRRPRITEVTYDTSLKQLKFDLGIYLDSIKKIIFGR